MAPSSSSSRSMESSRSSSLLEKLTPPGSPRTPATAFASTTASFRIRLPNRPSWLSTHAIQTAHRALCQTQARFGPLISHAYHTAAAAIPPSVASLSVPMRFRRLLHPYSLMFLALFVITNIGIFGHGGGSVPIQTYSGRPRNWAPPPGLSSTIHKSMPRKIWQSWKVNPLEFEERDHNVARSWTERNPDYRYEVLTDNNEMQYVEWHFGPEGFNRPDIVDFYRNVQATIVRADLLRYLVMYADGGVYADIDVEAIKPISKFIPERYQESDVEMVIGIEIDEPDWKDHPILGQKSRSFCQWTFMSKPQNPVMMMLVEQIMAWLYGVAHKQKVTISEVALDFDEIITGTGPSAFTNAILAYINRDRAGNRLTTWNDFHDLSESKLVNGVLVLTIEAFAAGQGHSDSGNHDARAALVRHHYHASNWPSRHPRYRHPVYGEVETCNWQDDCVHKWDDDVEKFKKLSDSEQRRLIEEHERETKEKEKAALEDERKRIDEEARRQREQQEEEERRRNEEDQRKQEEETRRKQDEERKKTDQKQQQ